VTFAPQTLKPFAKSHRKAEQSDTWSWARSRSCGRRGGAVRLVGMNGARLTVIGALIILLGALGNAITVRQPTAVIGFLVALLGAWWLIMGAARRDDPWAKRIVALIRPR
jgi:hypothetical protein